MNNKKILSLLILGSIATSNISVNAGIFSNLFTPPTTSELVFKYAKKAGKWSKKQLKASAKYVPGALVAAIVGTAVHRLANKAVDKLEEIPKKINSALKIQKLKTSKNALNKKVNENSGGTVSLAKNDIIEMLEYIKILEQKSGISNKR
ncbi:MAG: hypothetical protein UR12_C0004G0003 [candidate division TM6 bacterium GW2011_GWF2_30_66]|jgi:hypothetical protein|nr:MAG: hypothetical protein UR12_C0004G0003 [candidate division TM6 bacterium GW2011_GWF2_30_66]